MNKAKSKDDNPIKKLGLHIPLFISGIILAIALARSDVIKDLISASSAGSFILTSFIAGIFFATFFGAIPATVAFIEMAPSAPSLFLMAFFGGLGAVFSDLSIFQFIKFGIVDDLIAYFQRRSKGAFSRLFKIKFFQIFLIILGAIIIATPLPDEVGIAMIGIGKGNWKMIAILGIVLNGVGIFVIGLLAKSVIG